MIDRLQHGMPHCNQSPFFAPSCCQPVVPCVVKSILGAGGSPGRFSYYCFNLFVAVAGASAFFLPALLLLPGHIPAQEARCFSEGNALMSSPISAKRSSTVLVFRPGM